MKLSRYNIKNKKLTNKANKEVNIKLYTMILCLFVFIGTIIMITYSRFSTTTKVNVISAKVGQFVHRLYFDANKGEVNPTYKDIRMNSLYGELPIPERNGYTFNGWWTEKENGEEVTSLNEMGNEDLTIYAHWNKNNYNIIIKPNNGEWEGHTANQPYQLEYEEEMSIEDPTRTGYTFKGWNIIGEGSTYDSETKIFKMGYEEASIEAVWEINKYNLKIEYDNEEEDYDEDLEYEEEITIEEPEKEGYTFIGWEVSTEDDIATLIDGDNKYKQPAKDIKLTAKWQVNTYKWIVYHNKMNITGESYVLSETEEGEDEYGETFSGTLKNYKGFINPALQEKTIKVEEDYPPTKNVINYDYNRNKNSLTINPNGGKYNNTTNNTIEELYYQQEKEIEDPQRECYIFNNWNIKGEGSTIQNRIYKMGEEDSTIEATWNKIKYLITYNGNGGIINDTSKINQEIECGDRLTLLSNDYITRRGYNLKGWYKEATCENKIEDGYIPNKSETLYAKWEPDTYKITYELEGGIVNPANPVEYTIESEDIRLKNPTKDDFVFKGWSGTGLEGNENKEVIIESGSIGDRNYKANWKYKTYRIELNKQDGENGTDEIFERYNYGFYLDDESINEMTTTANGIEIPSKIGYIFKGYYTEENGQGTKYIDENGKLTNEALNDHFNTNGTLYAKWNLITYEITYDLDGGIPSQSNPINYTIESENIRLENPTKVGYNFVGWSGTDLNGNNNKEVIITTGSHEDRSYKANWITGLYEINFDKQSGQNGTDKIYEKYNEGYYKDDAATNQITSTNGIEIPSKIGYNFNGYFTGQNGSGTQFIDGAGKLTNSASNKYFTSNGTLYARWSTKSITCEAGKYLPANSETCSNCPKGSYCTGGTWTYDGSEKGRTGCGGGKYNDQTGSTTSSACKNISAGCYGTSAESVCPASCQGRTKYSVEGSSACSTVSNGNYTTGCNTSNNNCTGQSACAAGNFCVNGVSTACAQGSYSAAGASSCTACTGKTTSGTGKTSCDANCSNATGVSGWTTASWSNNTVSNLCKVSTCGTGYNLDTTNNKCTAKSITCSAGQYLPANSATCTSCPAGSYCTGGTWTYDGAEKGRSACSSLGSGYTSGAGATASTSCYISVSAGYYKTSATGASTAQCSAGYFKTAHNSYYNSSDSCTACAQGSYASGSGNSGCTACAAGTTTSGSGYSYCNTSCSNNSGVSYWNTPTWSNNYVNNLCSVGGCNTNYQKYDNRCKLMVCNLTYRVGSWVGHYSCSYSRATIYACDFDYVSCSNTALCTNYSNVSANMLNRYCPLGPNEEYLSSATGPRMNDVVGCDCETGIY